LLLLKKPPKHAKISSINLAYTRRKFKNAIYQKYSQAVRLSSCHEQHQS
jgi:hypothetical protein